MPRVLWFLQWKYISKLFLRSWTFFMKGIICCFKTCPSCTIFRRKLKSNFEQNVWDAELHKCNILGSKQVHPASVLINRDYLFSFIWYQFVLVRTNKYSDHHTMFTTIRMGPIVGLWKWKCLRGLVGHWTEANKGHFGTLRFQKTHTSDTTYKSCGTQIKDAFLPKLSPAAQTEIMISTQNWARKTKVS